MAKAMALLDYGYLITRISTRYNELDVGLTVPADLITKLVSVHCEPTSEIILELV
jgi:hypothetical protein